MQLQSGMIASLGRLWQFKAHKSMQGYIGGNAKAKELIFGFFRPAAQERKGTGRNTLSGKEVSCRDVLVLGVRQNAWLIYCTYVLLHWS